MSRGVDASALVWCGEQHVLVGEIVMKRSAEVGERGGVETGDEARDDWRVDGLQLLALLTRRFPQCEGKVLRWDLGTPLSTKH